MPNSSENSPKVAKSTHLSFKSLYEEKMLTKEEDLNRYQMNQERPPEDYNEDELQDLDISGIQG